MGISRLGRQRGRRGCPLTDDDQRTSFAHARGPICNRISPTPQIEPKSGVRSVYKIRNHYDLLLAHYSTPSKFEGGLFRSLEVSSRPKPESSEHTRNIVLISEPTLVCVSSSVCFV